MLEEIVPKMLLRKKIWGSRAGRKVTLKSSG